jgi:riboflavin synthase
VYFNSIQQFSRFLLLKQASPPNQIMFTGIIEATGSVVAIHHEQQNITFTIASPLSAELKVDQSLSHNGVCLTVISANNGHHQVTAIAETMSKTNLGDWQPGTIVNLERCLALNGRLDGHLVQGHVDATATCLQVEDEQGSWKYTFQYPTGFQHLLIEKGSICVNGISLTAFGLEQDRFSVAIIPFTYNHTNIHTVKPGDKVNLEFDMAGKYLARWHQLGLIKA